MWRGVSVVERRTGDREVLGSNTTGASSKLRQFRLLQCILEGTLKAIGPLYLVSIPGEVRDPIHEVNV